MPPTRATCRPPPPPADLESTLERTEEEDLQRELEFLIGFDRACIALKDWTRQQKLKALRERAARKPSQMMRLS